MFIKRLSQLTGVTPKTIRYYESIGLMPPPNRADNNYRIYGPDAVARLRLIAAARVLDFSLNDITKFLEARDQNLTNPDLLTSLDERIMKVDRSIDALLSLRKTLNALRNELHKLPPDHECDAQCGCYSFILDHQPSFKRKLIINE